MAFAVPNLLQATESLAASGVRMLEDQPVKGAGDFICNFLPPMYTRAFAVELVQVLEGRAMG